MSVDLKQFGDRPGAPDGRKVAAAPSSKAEPAPIARDRFMRIGKAPDASATSAMRNAMNYAMIHRSKEAFGWTSILGQGSGLPVTSAGAGLRKRFRFAFHTGPYSHALYARMFLYPQTAGFNSSSYAQLDIYSDTAEAVNVSSTKFYYGNNPLNTANVAGWQYMKVVNEFIDGLSADTDYFAVVSDGDNGLVQSVSVADMQSMTENYNGYLAANYTQESLILSTDRSTLLTPMPSLWKRGGAKVLNWTVDTQASPVTNATTTDTNIIDGSTTYGAAIPGFTLDMTGKARLSQPTGVPCKIWAYIDSTSLNNGVLRFRNSSGSVIANVNYLGAANTPHWASATLNMPATSDKWYLTSFQTVAAATIKTFAVSIFEYE
jgi:hypothetical protein